MSDPAIALLTVIWFAILLVGVTFTLLNWRHARADRRWARANGEDAETLFLADQAVRVEKNRLLVFGFLILMGVAVVIRQRQLIARDLFNDLFYGALEVAALMLAFKAVSVWRDRKKLYRMDAQQKKEEL
jgi:uncharacterized membrane protein YcjF (UPF0283 family)